MSLPVSRMRSCFGIRLLHAIALAISGGSGVHCEAVTNHQIAVPVGRAGDFDGIQDPDTAGRAFFNPGPIDR